MVKYEMKKYDNLYEIRARIHGEEIGFIQLISFNDKAEIRFFSVHSSYRRKGYAKAMFIQAIDMLHTFTSVKYIKVIPHSEDIFTNELISMKELYEVYARLGFEFVNKEINMSKLEQVMVLKIK